MKLIKAALGFFIFLSIALVAITTWFYQSVPKLNRMTYETLVQRAKESVKSDLKHPKSYYLWTPLAEISKQAKYSIIVSEDAGFYQHDGIDLDAISNSFEENIRRGGYFFGASTIPQQVVKNLFLTKEKSIIRKIREMILARQIVRRFKRDQILEIYLNIIELGPDIYGIGAASQYYFFKRPIDLNAAEGAFLGLLLPSPVKRHNTLYVKREMPKVRKAQIRRVLTDLEAMKIITPEELEQYLHYQYFGAPPEVTPESEFFDTTAGDDSEPEPEDEEE